MYSFRELHQLSDLYFSKIFILPSLLEIDHANMMDRVILAHVVHALSTKHIVGILAAVQRHVRTCFIYLYSLLLTPSLSKPRPTKMERLYMCQSRKSMWDKEMLLFQSEC